MTPDPFCLSYFVMQPPSLPNQNVCKNGSLVTVSVLWFFLTVLWVEQQCVIVVLPDNDHTHFHRGILFYKLIKGHLLKSNFGFDNCVVIMH